MNLTRASHELFRRTPDECFPSLDVLVQYCQWQKEQSLSVAAKLGASFAGPGDQTVGDLIAASGAILEFSLHGT